MKLGLIKFSPVCKNWAEEAAGYVWDENAAEDTPVKERDHAQDCARYYVRTKHICKIRRELPQR